MIDVEEEKRAYLLRLQTSMAEKGYGAEEVTRCVRYAERLLLSDLPVLFDGMHVRQVLRMNSVDRNRYHSFNISQGRKNRWITAPSKPLKARQRWILDVILSKLEVSPYAQGFERARSIKTNALIHADHDYVVCLDIRDYFPSIGEQAVVDVFHDAGYTVSAASALADICCYWGALPQGASTSPRLSNIIFKGLDFQLAEIAAKYDAAYSRYADDMVFSADCPFPGILGEVSALLAQYGFELNREKTQFYGPGKPKEITGLVVQNGVVRVPKAYRRLLKQEIYYCKKFGVLTHLENRNSRQYVNYREYLYGKAYYVQMIEPELGKHFLRELDQIEWPAYS